MTLTFGKYRGKDTDDLPSSYLRYLSVNLKEGEFCDDKLIDDCDDELRYRTKNNCHIGDD